MGGHEGGRGRGRRGRDDADLLLPRGVPLVEEPPQVLGLQVLGDDASVGRAGIHRRQVRGRSLLDARGAAGRRLGGPRRGRGGGRGARVGGHVEDERRLGAASRRGPGLLALVGAREGVRRRHEAPPRRPEGRRRPERVVHGPRLGTWWSLRVLQPPALLGLPAGLRPVRLLLALGDVVDLVAVERQVQQALLDNAGHGLHRLRHVLPAIQGDEPPAVPEDGARVGGGLEADLLRVGGL
mmetsp:Transcript_109559/g.316771  ORF Transcript_109559/g.316771 Transcript_109559/m.316771 type:complete len:239 (+) Transcript_109559:780-1496(+)